MHYTKYSINSFIHQAGILVKNSQEVGVVREAVMQYGYDERRLKSGEQVFLKLKDLSYKQHKAKASKVELYRRKHELQLHVHKVYMKYLKIARIAFSEDLKARSVLLLDGGRARTYKDWYYQVSVFCSIMQKNDDGYLEVMAGFGIESEQIEELRVQLKSLGKLNDECIKSAGELRKLTADKKKLVVEMQSYVSDFLKIARIALEHSPKVLQSLGVDIKS